MISKLRIIIRFFCLTVGSGFFLTVGSGSIQPYLQPYHDLFRYKSIMLTFISIGNVRVNLIRSKLGLIRIRFFRGSDHDPVFFVDVGSGLFLKVGSGSGFRSHQPGSTTLFLMRNHIRNIVNRQSTCSWQISIKKHHYVYYEVKA